MALKVHMKLLDISKAYDKEWHNGLTFTLCQNGICVEVVNFLLEFHRDRVFQTANGCFELIIKLVYHKVQFWNSFLFFIYISNISNMIKSKWKSFAINMYSISSVRGIDA